MKTFGTQGPVNPREHYIVTRTAELADFIHRVKAGRYIVIFAPRQTGKTTFFQRALETLAAEEKTYFLLPLNFDVYKNVSVGTFYAHLSTQIRESIGNVFQKLGHVPSEAFSQFLEEINLTDHLSMLTFFKHLAGFLEHQEVVLFIDEFDGIPQAALSDFLQTLRHIYLSGKPRCPHSVGIVGVKNITQLNYERSISPFNIQDEFHLPNFTLEQVQELLAQYTAEVGQSFTPDVIESIHKQTAGQPFLVNRAAQILTEELDIPKGETITMAHFEKAHTKLLQERNTNIEHLTTNVRRDPCFQRLLMDILSYEEGVEFNLDTPLISELATYGVISRDTDGMCKIVNPIYLYRILRTFKPTVNGLEQEYFAEENMKGFHHYLTPTGQLAMEALLDNFRAFIARAGFKILQVPETPRESVGRHLLLTYLDSFVKAVGGSMFFEVSTGRGKIDLLISYKARKYIVETKIWRGALRYQAGKQQLAAYLKSEGAAVGYYVVFDHRETPVPRVETDTLAGVKIRSYVIPVMQEAPSAVHP